MLADAGFDVIKLEPPPLGDFIRHLPARISEFDSGYFRQANAGKRSICVDLKAPAGRELFWRLIPHFDVVMHNMRPNAAKRLGITAEAVHAVNPAAVFVHISGYGSDNTFVGRPGQDLAVQCLTGIADLTGVPRGAPSMPIWSLVDTLTSAYAYVSICSALLGRETGTIGGASVEVLMSQCSALLHDVAPHLIQRQEGKRLSRGGRFHPYFVLRGVVRCADGFVAISAFRQRDWRRLAGLLRGVFSADLCLDDRWARKQEIEDAVDARLAGLSVTECLDLLRGLRIPAYVVPESLGEVERSGVFQNRGMLVRSPEGALLVAGMLHRARAAEHINNGSPPLGGANYEVLTSLGGFQGAELLELLADGVIGCEPMVLEEFVMRCSLPEEAVVA
jgi:crotonobetainyl-CoA:carnitine CoA-transferase CaiB-like acyl-CoA transferase